MWPRKSGSLLRFFKAILIYSHTSKRHCCTCGHERVAVCSDSSRPSSYTRIRAKGIAAHVATKEWQFAQILQGHPHILAYEQKALLHMWPRKSGSLLRFFKAILIYAHTSKRHCCTCGHERVAVCSDSSRPSSYTRIRAKG